MNKPLRAESTEARATNVRIGNAADCRKAIWDAVAQRACEIYERSGRQPGCDRKNWFLAESEILKPLSEVCIEPHRLIVMAHKDSNRDDWASGGLSSAFFGRRNRAILRKAKSAWRSARDQAE